MFNDNEFLPEVFDLHDDITDDDVYLFVPQRHPHIREGKLLKARWNKLGSSYTIARDKITRSEQEDAEVSTNFTEGDPPLSYMHCVFYKSPALEYVLRSIPADARDEQGIKDLDSSRNLDDVPSRKRKASSADVQSGNIEALAKAMATPIHSASEKGAYASQNNSDKIAELELSDRMAGTVSKLMDLEGQLLTRIEAAKDVGNTEFASILQVRLSNVRARIDKAFAGTN